MPLLLAYALMAQAAQGAPTAISVQHRRPSAIVALAKGLDGTLVADDARSRIEVSGTPEQVRAARELIRLYDVPRKPLLLQVLVNSPVDHYAWKVDARLTNGQRWKTADEETRSEVALDPILGADGTLKVMVLARCNGVELSSMFRLTKGQAQTLVLGKRVEQQIDVSSSGDVSMRSESATPLPTVTVRYVGN